MKPRGLPQGTQPPKLSETGPYLSTHQHGKGIWVKWGQRAGRALLSTQQPQALLNVHVSPWFPPFLHPQPRLTPKAKGPEGEEMSKRLRSGPWVPGPVLALHIYYLTYLIFLMTLREGTVITPMLQMRKRAQSCFYLPICKLFNQTKREEKCQMKFTLVLHTKVLFGLVIQ